MLTVLVSWIAASYIIGIGVALDQLRRPLSVWEAAGRDRSFWVTATFILGFHGLGEYIAIAYFVGVVPRLKAVQRGGRRRMLQRPRGAVVGVWRRVGRAIPKARSLTVAQQLVLTAALLEVGAAIIHAAEIAPHLEQYWLFGTFFAVTAVLQAAWAALIYRDPLNRRLLVAGAVGNAALVAVWAISRTVGVPVGPGSWTPEAVGVLDVLCKLDELGCVVLVAMVLGAVRETRRAISRLDLRLAVMLTGTLVIYSVLLASGGHVHHHLQ
jgi:hypothetical protein